MYALGQLGQPRDFDLLSETLAGDESGYVRQAAWLAAACVDDRRCAALLKSAPPAADGWEEIGAAEARLQLHDAAGIDVLLRFAADGDLNQRSIAGRALFRTLAPALTSAGRWPLGATLNPDGSMSRELVDEIARRAAAMDVGVLMNETWTCVERSSRLLRAKARLSGARDRIAGLLLLR